MKPGVSQAKRMPSAMPKVQSMAMALSSRTRLWRSNHLMPKPEATAKRAAPQSGEKPSQAPNPTPPREACAIPPPAMTARRVTMNVPMTAQSTDTSKLPSRASRKKGKRKITIGKFGSVAAVLCFKFTPETHFDALLLSPRPPTGRPHRAGHRGEPRREASANAPSRRPPLPAWW